MTGVSVQHDEAAHRFFAEVDGRKVTMDYGILADGRADFRSTFTPPELRGRGLAAAVVDTALAWARERKLEIVPSCWYVKKRMEEENAA